MHSGIALAVRDLQPREAVARERNYVSYVIMNLRKFCKPPFNEPEHAMMTCHTNSTSSLVVRVSILSDSEPIIAQSPDEFKYVLDQVQNFYKTKAGPRNLLDAALCFAARTLTYPTGSCAAPSPISSPSVSLSSRWITDNFIQAKYGPFEVHDPLPVDTEQPPGLGVSLATWIDAVCLRAAFNEAFQEAENVQSFLESVKRVVIEGLEIVG